MWLLIHAGIDVNPCQYIFVLSVVYGQCADMQWIELVPASINRFLLNIQFYQNTFIYIFSFIYPITKKFCTFQVSIAVLEYASFFCDWISCLWTIAKNNFIEFRIRSNYGTDAWWPVYMEQRSGPLFTKKTRRLIVRRAGLLWSQQDFEWRWSVPLFKCLTVLEFSFILFDLCLFITFFNFIMNYVPIVTFWIFTYHKIWILSIMFCFVWSYWIIYFLACLEVSWGVVS